MSEISILERRISAALARIGKATDAMEPHGQGAPSTAAPPPAVVEVIPDHVQSELEQLRLDLVASQTQAAAQETFIADQSAEAVALKAENSKAANHTSKMQEALAGLERNLDRLRQSNDDLRRTNADLRAANATGVGDAELINAALHASLESAVAERDVVKTQVDHLMQALTAAEQDNADA